ncbi:3'-5' exoribonuclease YhaM family protein [Desertibacillus haloalkaliphilus]|uniref:3'-5' exoribonuclease YhaM family protein n=1 Tax=Desertibacillus haloalkaliphilus TaxID=1328930 RepID=UPI001C26E8C0|nr:HD domain-containing protein [Desertibacillus haloalkaliphilus]MBU8907608.1 HD domain-containing protein [Desertibacillus haloalkaliphilus]
MRKVIQSLEVNQTIKEHFLLTRIEVKRGKNGSYFELTLADTSGEITARKWDLTERDWSFYEGVKQEVPTVVLVKGIVRKFLHALDIKIFYIVQPVENQEISLREFIPTAPIDIDKAFEKIEVTIENIKNDKIQAIVKQIYDKYHSYLAHYPASTHHHRTYGGLIWHTVNVLKLSDTMLQLYPDLLQYDLLISGAILHDLAKVKDYKVNRGTVTHMTDTAKLIGHVVGISHDIYEAAYQLGIDPVCTEVELLEHIVVSHHGKREFGSPVEPAIPEAVALHYIDMLDTKVGAVQQVLEHTQVGEWSEWSKVVNGRVKKLTEGS